MLFVNPKIKNCFRNVTETDNDCFQQFFIVMEVSSTVGLYLKFDNKRSSISVQYELSFDYNYKFILIMYDIQYNFIFLYTTNNKLYKS